MKIENLIKLSNFFYCLAQGSNLDVLLDKLQELDNFSARKQYAEKYFKHLSSGSSRIVYLTPEHTIIKLAKNSKGIAQNRAESNPKMYSPYINKILSRASNYSWIQTNYLDKITEKDFKRMTGLNFKDFGEAVRYALKNVSENSEIGKPPNFEEISKSEIFEEIKRLGQEFDLMPGDIARISSWGKKNNQPVLIDAGLTKGVFDKFYDSSS